MGIRKSRFSKIENYIEFAKYYLEFIETELQAEIIAQNETNYRFFQYRRDGEYNITRPVNGDLFFTLPDYEKLASDFEYTLENIRDIENDIDKRENLNKFIYTTQQTIGCALDALPASKTNTSRKVNGEIVAIGSVKTSSKDRIDKIFLDKLM